MKTIDVLERLEELFLQEIRTKNNWSYKEVIQKFYGSLKITTYEYAKSLETNKEIQEQQNNNSMY